MRSTKFCKVCGYQLAEDLFAICDCCGTQSGYEDLTESQIDQRRKDWIKKGMPWFNESLRPANWRLEEQLKNLDKNSIQD